MYGDGSSSELSKLSQCALLFSSKISELSELSQCALLFSSELCELSLRASLLSSLLSSSSSNSVDNFVYDSVIHCKHIVFENISISIVDNSNILQRAIDV